MNNARDGAEQVDDIGRLFEAAKHGDLCAEDELIAQVRQLAAPLVANPPAHLQGVVDKEDILQQVSITVLHQVSTFDFRTMAEFMQYLRKVSDSESKNLIEYHGAQKRDRSREESMESPVKAAGATPHELAEVQELQNRLFDSLNQLDPASAKIFIAVKLEGRTVADVAREIGQSHSTTTYQLDRARATLALSLGKDFL